MADPLLGAWEVDVPKVYKKKTVSCNGCLEAFSGGELRCTWISFAHREDDPPHHAFHLRCVPKAAGEGLCQNISSRNVNRSRGLTKIQVEELQTAKNATQEPPLTPQKDIAVEVGSSQKEAQPTKAKAASKAKKCSQDEPGQPTKKAKKSDGCSAGQDAEADGMRPKTYETC